MIRVGTGPGSRDRDGRRFPTGRVRYRYAGSVARLPSFPNPVNEVAARFVAGGVVLIALAALALDLPWLLVPLAYGFVARALAGPRFSPLALLVTEAVVPRLSVAPRLVAGPPKRFAQAIGAVLTVSAAVLHLVLGLEAWADALLVALIAFATLESVFALCVGCKVFGLLMRVGVIPDDVCADCADIWSRPGRVAHPA